MKITLTNTQRLTLFNLLKKPSAGGTKLPPIQPDLQNVLDLLEQPFEDTEKTYTLPMSEATARVINQRLYTHFGFLMDPDPLQNPHPQEDVIRIVYRAIEETFKDYELIGKLRKKERTTISPTPPSNNATLCIIFEIDGAIMGYFVLTDSILADIDNSEQDDFTYLFDSKNNPPTLHDQLNDALADIKAQGLELKEEYGCCAY